MKRFAVPALLLTLMPSGLMAQDAKSVITAAARAMGAENLTSITYSGAAADVSFLQSRQINLPLRPITNYVRAIDLTAPASRHTGNTNNPPGGPQTGPPVPGVFNQAVTAQQAVATQPWGSQVELWITPWAFLKGAVENNATLRTQRMGGRNFNVLSWSPAVKARSGASYVINGYINEENLVERVESWLENDVLGDMHIEAIYTDWKDFGGIKVPARIVQRRGELPFFEVTVTAARANPTDIATLIAGPPAPARGGRGGGRGGAPGGRGAAAPVTASSEQMAAGVYRIIGGYVSLAVEFDDYIMVLEGGENEARSLASIAEIKRAIPNKPIRYVFNTHPHSDHAGGLAAYVAEGATIVTHENNRKFFEDAYSTPRTLLNDSLAKAQADAKANGRTLKPNVEGVGDKKVYKDRNHSVELYYLQTGLGNKKEPDYTPHSEGWMVAYLPKEKILFQGDFTVNPGQPANDHVMQVLAPNVFDRLKLDFEYYVPVHPATPNVAQSRADVLKAIGR